jgi:hypothetical protein
MCDSNMMMNETNSVIAQITCSFDPLHALAQVGVYVYDGKKLFIVIALLPVHVDNQTFQVSCQLKPAQQQQANSSQGHQAAKGYMLPVITLMSVSCVALRLKSSLYIHAHVLVAPRAAYSFYS